MTEDDTFDKLRQLPFKEAAAKYMEWWLAEPLNSWASPLTTENADRFLKQYGWTFSQLHNAIEQDRIHIKSLEGK